MTLRKISGRFGNPVTNSVGIVRKQKSLSEKTIWAAPKEGLLTTDIRCHLCLFLLACVAVTIICVIKTIIIIINIVIILILTILTIVITIITIITIMINIISIITVLTFNIIIITIIITIITYNIIITTIITFNVTVIIIIIIAIKLRRLALFLLYSNTFVPARNWSPEESHRSRFVASTG